MFVSRSGERVVHTHGAYVVIMHCQLADVCLLAHIVLVPAFAFLQHWDASYAMQGFALRCVWLHPPAIVTVP